MVWSEGQGVAGDIFLNNSGINSHTFQLKSMFDLILDRGGKKFSNAFCNLLTVWTSQLLLSPGSYGFKHMPFLYLLSFYMLQSLCHPHWTALAVVCSSGLHTVTAKEPFP